MTLTHDTTIKASSPEQALVLARRYVYRTFAVWRSWSADITSSTDTHYTIRITISA